MEPPPSSCSSTKRSCGRCGSGRASRRSRGKSAGSGWPPTSRAGPGSGATDISAQCAGSTSGCDWSSPSSIEEPERGLSRLLPLATSAGGGQRPRTHARRDGRFAARGRARPAYQARRRWDLVSARGRCGAGWEFRPDGHRRAGRGDRGRGLRAQLIPFGCLSEAEAHTIHYPNGNVTHCFALLFLARIWQGDPRPDQEESTATKFVDLGALPNPLHPPTSHALELLTAYLRSGAFQVR